MGQCCASSSFYDGELFISSIFSDSHFMWQTFDYNRLLNTIVKYRINQEIHKKQIEEKIIPLFFNKNDPTNPYLRQHNAFFSEILSWWQDKNNIYSVILLFYPYINHANEDMENTWYQTFNFIQRNCTQNTAIALMEKYIKNMTYDLTFTMWMNCQDEGWKAVWSELNKTVYNIKNVKEYVERMMFPIIKEWGSNEVVPMGLFRQTLKQWDIGDFKKMRARFVNEFSEK